MDCFEAAGHRKQHYRQDLVSINREVWFAGTRVSSHRLFAICGVVLSFFVRRETLLPRLVVEDDGAVGARRGCEGMGSVGGPFYRVYFGVRNFMERQMQRCTRTWPRPMEKSGDSPD